MHASRTQSVARAVWRRFNRAGLWNEGDIMTFSAFELTRRSQRKALRANGGRRHSFASRLRALRASGESGQALAEFAVVAPCFLLLTFGMCIFGLALNSQLTLTNAVEQGAQALSISRGVADPCATAVAAVKAAAPNLNWSATGISWSITVGSGNTTTSTSCTSYAADMVSGATGSVSVTYPFSQSILGAATFASGSWNFASSYSMSASTTEVIQ
jgi:Flp pilus assembly protein TadG